MAEMRPETKRAIAGLLLAATALATPQVANAETRREAELAARLERLESEMAALRADLAAARETTATTAATTQQTAARVATLESKPATPAPAPAPAEGFRAGSTTIKLGGYLKMIAANSRYSEGEVATNSLGRDFYLPQAIPTGNGPSSQVQDFTAKQSRLWLNFASDIAGHTVKGYLETDFQTSAGTQGSQRTTNGYNLALRRAYMQLDKWTFGQDWTTFQYTGALPESTDYVGGAEGTVFVRQPLVRYSAPLSKELTLHLSVENPESGTLTAGSATLNENGDDRMPDLAARLAYAGAKGELSLAALARQVRTESAGVAADAGGFGASAAGKLFLNDAKTADARFMVTYGRNIGRYVGLNFAPDAVLNAGKLADVDVLAAIGAVRVPLAPGLRANVMASYQTVDYADSLTLASAAGKLFLNDAKTADARFMVTYGRNIGRYVGLNFAPDAVLNAGKLADVDVLAAIGAVRVPLAPGLRANVMASYQTVDYADSLTLASISTFNKQAWSAAANLFYSPVKNIDLGIELRHGERKLVSGAKGAIDRVEFAAKYSF